MIVTIQSPMLIKKSDFGWPETRLAEFAVYGDRIEILPGFRGAITRGEAEEVLARIMHNRAIYGKGHESYKDEGGVWAVWDIRKKDWEAIVALIRGR